MDRENDRSATAKTSPMKKNGNTRRKSSPVTRFCFHHCAINTATGKVMAIDLQSNAPANSPNAKR